jgi:hypothetical protein
VLGTIRTLCTPVETLVAGRIPSGKSVFLPVHIPSHCISHHIGIDDEIIRRTVQEHVPFNPIGISDTPPDSLEGIQPHQGFDAKLPFLPALSFLFDKRRGFAAPVPGNSGLGIGSLRSQQVQGGTPRSSTFTARALWALFWTAGRESGAASTRESDMRSRFII